MGKFPNEIPLSQVQQVAKRIAKDIRGGEIFGLVGPLGSGKTTFVKALGKALGIKQVIPSPTFVMMQEFNTTKAAKNALQNLILYHLDLYRTNSFAEVKGLGITEWWGRPETVMMIEWADKIRRHLPPETIILNFYRDTHDS